MMSSVCEEYNDSSFDQCIDSWINTQTKNLFNCDFSNCQLENHSTLDQTNILDFIIGDTYIKNKQFKKKFTYSIF
jgi:hypothetical protein